jgi:transcription-repair coupling factor (superfamily II helicase)
MARKPDPVAYVLSDGQRIAIWSRCSAFVAPDIPVLTLPGWDCLPYDRVSPSAEVSAPPLSALSALIAHQKKPHAAIVLVTVNAMLQKTAPRAMIDEPRLLGPPGNQIRMDDHAARLERNGFERVATVREVGEYAVRGGILDVFRARQRRAASPRFLRRYAGKHPLLRSRQPAHDGQARSLELNPMSEVTLTPETISHFRKQYLAAFGAATRDDALYQAVSEGRRYAGMEHWLPLFYDGAGNRLRLSRRASASSPTIGAARRPSSAPARARLLRRAPCHPRRPARGRWRRPRPTSRCRRASSISMRDALRRPWTAQRHSPRPSTSTRRRGAPGRDDRGPAGRALGAARSAAARMPRASASTSSTRRESTSPTSARPAQGAGHRLVGRARSIACLQVLSEHGLGNVVRRSKISEISRKLKPGEAGSAVLSLESGFETGDLVVIGEQDILGDRMVRRAKRRKRGADFITEVAGAGRGLDRRPCRARHRPLRRPAHDRGGRRAACLPRTGLCRRGKLFLPVENIDLLSRYGGEGTDAMLDKLGGVAWQARKAKLKKRLLDMANGLIQIAAARSCATRRC